MNRRSQGLGFTLIEVIIFIVIVSIALLAVLQVMNAATARSSDPMVAKQALSIAEAMMDEILSTDYQNAETDPNNGSSTLGCTPSTTPACPQNANPRSNYNDVMDYNNFNQTASTPLGDPIFALGSYNVQVSVVEVGLGGVSAREITVTVTGGGNSIVLKGHRTNYEF